MRSAAGNVRTQRALKAYMGRPGMVREVVPEDWPEVLAALVGARQAAQGPRYGPLYNPGGLARPGVPLWVAGVRYYVDDADAVVDVGRMAAGLSLVLGRTVVLPRNNDGGDTVARVRALTPPALAARADALAQGPLGALVRGEGPPVWYPRGAPTT